MSIFGNGVLEGWTVTAEESFSVGISEGSGNINFNAARTEFPSSITDIPPNSVNYVFARLQEQTRFTEQVDFILSPTRNINDLNHLLLASVTTGPLSIESIDNSIRQEIGFIELIKSAIRLHKHRGGSLNPSKIDLQTEVKGQLPSFRIADFDAEKITTGRFDLSRMPILNHQDLQNVGLTPHSGLDSFVKTLEQTNKELLGEIGAADLLQLIIAMKLIYDDPQSIFYNSTRTVDYGMINEIIVIPGITPDQYIDVDNTTAEVNYDGHFIKGVPPVSGTSFYVRYDTAVAWNSAYSRQNLINTGNSITLAFNEDEESKIVTIEGFESATKSGEFLSGETGGQTLFEKEIVIISDNGHITSNSSATNVIEGFYSGQFRHQESFRSQFVKSYDAVQDWSTYDSFVVSIKCLDSIHGPVKLYFEDADGNKSIDYTLLSQDQVTSNTDPAENSFEMRVIDLATVSFRSAIKKFVIYTDDLINPFKFYVDFINIQRAILLPEQGVLKLRYSSNNNLTFSTIDWETTEVPDSQIKVRARSASGSVFLTRSDYTPYLSNGELVNLVGTDIEIEITFLPDSNRLVSPVLHSLRLLIVSEAEIDGYSINDVDEFSRGETSNVTINESPTALTLSNPVYVDSYYFCLFNNVSQIKQSIENDISFASSELTVSGLNSPIAPNQIFKAIEDGDSRVTTSRLFEPRSVIRQSDRTFVIADTFNDRVLQFDESGNLVAGIGSINYEHTEKVFPISATIDTRTNIAYIVWSKAIPFKSVNVSKIVIQTTTQQIQLIQDFDKIKGLSSSEISAVSAEGQIMPIHLSSQNAALVQNLTGNTYTLMSNDVLLTGFDADSVFYKAIVTAIGIPTFVGNFAYVDGIFTPTYADKTEEGGFIVANATLAVKEYDFPSTITERISKNSIPSTVVEFDKNNTAITGLNTLLFSPFVPGNATKLDSKTILMSGIKPDGVPGSLGDAKLDFRSLSSDQTIRATQKDTLNKLFFPDTNPFRGAVVVFDKQTKVTLFEYNNADGILSSDADIDPRDGTYVVAETSFTQSGRVVKLDATGNVTFSFGEGLYSMINDVDVGLDGSIVVST